MRDQNLVVRGKNYCLFGCVFFISSKDNLFGVKIPSSKDNLFVFFILKEKKLKVELKLIRNLIKKENENIFVILLFACFCYF